jgi:hypothetical protein
LRRHPQGQPALYLIRQSKYDTANLSGGDASSGVPFTASQQTPGSDEALPLNGNLSAIGWHKYRKNYWRELSVNYVIDAAAMSSGDTQPILAQHGSVTVDSKAELAKA